MEDAKPLLDHWLSEDHYLDIALCVVDAYRKCDEFFDSNVVTASFLPGVEQRSNFLNVFVQYALLGLADRTGEFFCEVKPNAAKNCRHTRIHKGTLSLTAHFVGRGCGRSSARSTLYLDALASKNYDLFPDTTPCQPPSHLHCQLLHGGWVTPQVLSLVIPTADQDHCSHAMTLSIPEITLTDEEKIRDAFGLKLVEIGDKVGDAEQAS